jgi:hypothetical protein
MDFNDHHNKDDDKTPAVKGTGGTKTIEEWAEAKGMLPETIAVPARLGSRELKAPKQNPKFVLYIMAKAHRQWPQGKEVTEAEFDKAVAESGQVGIK